MKFQLMSDLHGKFEFLTEPEDKDTYLILSGDIDEVNHNNKLIIFINKVCSTYKGVFYLPGNHEYYDSNIHKVNSVLKELNDSIENLHVLLNTDYLLEDDDKKVLVLGSTLWSSFNNRDPVAMNIATLKMNDYKYIRHGPLFESWKRKLQPHDTINFHEGTVKYLKETITKYRKEYSDIKVLMCVHHAPCTLSIHPQFIGNDRNAAYCTDMNDFILDYKPDIITHGHMHNSFDYNFGSTRIICNPRGYEDFGHAPENKDFNERNIASHVRLFILN